MRTFKDFIRNDMKSFFNLNEFAEEHTINGKKITIIIDNNKLIERAQKEFDGLSVGEILYYVKSEDLGEMPEQGTSQYFDGRNMFIFNIREDNGIYEVILQQYRGE